jgi:Protein of unknown function (DUF4065)
MNISIDLSNIGPDKLEELVLHIAKMSENDPRFMSTKLNKLVWAADFAAFCETGRTITGATYQREKYGPVPKAMPIVLNTLKAKQRIELRPVQITATATGARPVAKATADLSAFSQNELATVDKVIAENFRKTGTDLSRETHRKVVWSVSENGDSIPFSAWFISTRAPSPSEKRSGMALEKTARAILDDKAA